MSSSRKNIGSSPWWGTFALEENTGGRWQVGPSSVWIFRTPNEWRVIHDPAPGPGVTDPLADRSEAMVPATEEELLEATEADAEQGHLKIFRHSFRKTEKHIALLPALADRPIVTRPEQPLYVPTGESVTLYLSSPLWIRLELPDTEHRLQEFPSFRMSDTWFGASTLVGELCYAARTSGRLRLNDMPLRLHRAITPVRIVNKAGDALHVERIQLPAPHLSIYRAEDNALWTEAVTMTRRHGLDGAHVDIRHSSPSDAGDAELIQQPREISRKSLVTSTFSAVGSLFSS